MMSLIDLYAVMLNGQPLSQYELFMTSLRTGNTRNVTNATGSEERYPAVSADGKQILFTSNRWGKGEFYNVFLTDPEGKRVEQRTQLEDVCYLPTWSADGRTIAFGIGNTSEAGLLEMTTRRMARLPDMRDSYLSPDGSKITFTQKVGKGFAVFMMNRDDNQVKQLTQHESEQGGVGPVFSPDSKQILYCDDVDGKEISEIFVINADGADN